MTETETIERTYIDIKEIAEKTRRQLKQEFPGCKFSVNIERYSMGQSLHVSLMEADFQVKKRFEEISERAILEHEGAERVKKLQEENYHQLNDHFLKEDFDDDQWCNGIFLTRMGHEVLARVVQIANQYNWDHSDAMTDYSDVNFYLHLNLGAWNKPFKEVL